MKKITKDFSSKINNFKIKNTDLEKMPLDTLKNSLANLLLNNENIAENEELSDLIDFVYNLDITTNQQKDDLVKFVEIIKNVENKNISAEDALACKLCSTVNIEHDNKMQNKFVVLDKSVQHDKKTKTSSGRHVVSA